jgi:hypothetical protein
VGCKSATRLSINEEERQSHFVIRHTQSASQALSKVEVALAEMYNDLPAVLKLKQPETGTLILKPLVSYRVGGALGAEQNARYTLKIAIHETSIKLDFELGQEISSSTWAPETEIPKIKADFRTITTGIAKAVNGTLEESR